MPVSGDGRPDPDALLRAAAQEGRGRFKVFLGAAPGVGKTFEMLSEGAARRRDGVDVVVHNAGITRDKKLANMAEDRWGSVVAVNLTAPELISRELLDSGVINAGGGIRHVVNDAGAAVDAAQPNGVVFGMTAVTRLPAYPA